MSTIVISNIKAKGETASRAVSGVASAWGKFDGSLATPAFNESVNFSSIVDNGTGNYNMSFTNNISYPYSFQGSCGDHNFGTTTIRILVVAADNQQPTSSGFRCFSLYVGNANAVTNFDLDYGFITIHGDLA